MIPAIRIAAAVEAACDVDTVTPYRPAQLAARSAFVTPAETWKEIGEATFGHLEMGLDVFLVSALSDQEQALDWLDVQSSILLRLAPIDVDTDEVIATSVDAPFVFSNIDGVQFLSCKITYTRARFDR